MMNFRNIFFTYPTMTKPLLENVTVSFSQGWTGVVGVNGAGKTTVLKLAAGMLTPQQGHAHIPENAIYCPQRTDDAPEGLTELMSSVDSDACEIKGRLGIEEDWLKRWDTLSHGERKRAQIATALWRQPDVLAIDEPTNHIDFDARVLLSEALRTFHGIGLLVSHDRELLDSLCRQCLFVDPPDAVMRPGGYTKGSDEARKEVDYTRKQYEHAKNTRGRLEREAARHRENARRADHKLSKRRTNIKDHDAREKIDKARVSGKDGVSGKLLKQLEGRLRQTQNKQNQIKVKKTYEMGIWMPGSCSTRNSLFILPAGNLPLGKNRQLSFPELAMRADERIALTGQNGSGKSTLIRHVLKSLNVPEEHVTYVPQEIDLESSKKIMESVRALPGNKLGMAMNVVSRLGSRPHRLLETDEPSPGEMRKILLALGMVRVPHLIIMDEPTNHMDLPSIECLEKALSNCPCGLLLISHDRQFLDRLTETFWNIESNCLSVK